jgi:hypothetical protein
MLKLRRKLKRSKNRGKTQSKTPNMVHETIFGVSGRPWSDQTQFVV